MNKLIWELFLMLREVMPPSADNTRRQATWAARFQRETGYEDMTAEPAPAIDEMARPEIVEVHHQAVVMDTQQGEDVPAEEEHSANPHVRRPVAQPKTPPRRKK